MSLQVRETQACVPERKTSFFVQTVERTTFGDVDDASLAVDVAVDGQRQRMPASTNSSRLDSFLRFDRVCFGAANLTIRVVARNRTVTSNVQGEKAGAALVLSERLGQRLVVCLNEYCTARLVLLLRETSSDLCQVSIARQS